MHLSYLGDGCSKLLRRRNVEYIPDIITNKSFSSNQNPTCHNKSDFIASSGYFEPFPNFIMV
jgi:hypothetical protein